MTIPDDELRRLLHEAAEAAPVDTAALQTELTATLERARRARTARTVTASAVGVVLLGGVAWGAAAQPWNSPAPEPTETVTVTPSATTAPTAAPTPTPTPTTTPTPDPSATPEPPPAPEGSDIAYPVCGEVFALPERAPQLSLELEGEVREIAIEGVQGVEGTAYPSMLTADLRATNDGITPIAGGLDYTAFLVVTDAEGRVLVSSANPRYPTAESGVILNLAPGDATTFAGEAGSSMEENGCDGGATRPDRLVDPGSYQVFALRNVWQDGEVVQQGQGGPWPIEIAAEPEAAVVPAARELLEGAAPLPECGAPFDPLPATGTTLAATSIRSPRAASDNISELSLTLSTSRALVGEPTAATVIFTRDGVRVSEISGSDSGEHLYLSAGSRHETLTWSTLQDCNFEPLPPGTYLAHPIVFDMGGELEYWVLARAEAQEVIVE